MILDTGKDANDLLYMLQCGEFIANTSVGTHHGVKFHIRGSGRRGGLLHIVLDVSKGTAVTTLYDKDKRVLSNAYYQFDNAVFNQLLLSVQAIA